MKHSLPCLFFMMLSHLLWCQIETPFLVSAGGDFQTDGVTNIHLAVGEPVVVAGESGEQSVGLGFFHALSLAEPCPPDDQECICARSPNNPECIEVVLDAFNFLLDANNFAIPPPNLVLDGPFDLSVFNRWGKLEYSSVTDGDQITTWEGLDQDGELLPNGVYYYVLEHPDCKNEKCKGSITILREN